MSDRKLCYAAGCKRVLSGNRRKYCSDRCANRIQTQKKRAKAKGIKWVQPEEEEIVIPSQRNVQSRRGVVYNDLKESGLGEDILKGKTTVKDVAKILETSVAAVSMAYQAYLEDLEQKAAQDEWQLPQVAEKSLQDFRDFRDRYFQTETGDPYETPEFHIKWINSILDAIEHGNQQMILSPPRHGKTDLLIHFAVWLICTKPNIRILWVGGNEEIAKNAVSSVLDQLESNELLIEEICGPGPKFKPTSRTGKSWSQNGFTVGTRTVTGIKSPTMVGIGRGGKIL